MHVLFSMLWSEDRGGVDHFTWQGNEASFLHNYQICFYRELFSTARLQPLVTLCHLVNIQKVTTAGFPLEGRVPRNTGLG